MDPYAVLELSSGCSEDEIKQLPRSPPMDPYKILEILIGCSEEKIKEAYKVQRFRWHPDKNKGNEEEAQKRFVEVHEAFTLLSIKMERAKDDKKKEEEREKQFMDLPDDIFFNVMKKLDPKSRRNLRVNKRLDRVYCAMKKRIELVNLKINPTSCELVLPPNSPSLFPSADFDRLEQELRRLAINNTIDAVFVTVDEKNAETGRILDVIFNFKTDELHISSPLPLMVCMDPYAVLELVRGCNDADIRAALKVQRFRWHPDKNIGNEEEAKKRFVLATAAHKVLFDKTSRGKEEKEMDDENEREERAEKEAAERAEARRRKAGEEKEKKKKEERSAEDQEEEGEDEESEEEEEEEYREEREGKGKAKKETSEDEDEDGDENNNSKEDSKSNDDDVDELLAKLKIAEFRVQFLPSLAKNARKVVIYDAIYNSVTAKDLCELRKSALESNSKLESFTITRVKDDIMYDFLQECFGVTRETGTSFWRSPTELFKTTNESVELYHYPSNAKISALYHFEGDIRTDICDKSFSIKNIRGVKKPGNLMKLKMNHSYKFSG